MMMKFCIDALKAVGEGGHSVFAELESVRGELSGIPHTLLYMRAFSYALPWATISAFQLRTNIIALVVSLPKQGRNMCVLCVCVLCM